MYVNVYHDRYDEPSLKSEQRQICAEDILYMREKPVLNSAPWTYIYVKREGDSWNCYAPYPPAIVTRALAVLQTKEAPPPSAPFPLTNGGPEPEFLSRTLDLTNPNQMVLTDLTRDPADPNVILTEERILTFKPKPASALRVPGL